MSLGDREFDVFLSYHSGDAVWVERLHQGLKDRGLRIWIDSEQVLPGDRFAEVLEKGLAASGSVILVVSKGSIASSWVKEEYYRALGLANAADRPIRLIPALIDGVSLPGFLASRSWVDFRNDADLSKGLERLVPAIKASESAPMPEPTAIVPTTPARGTKAEVDYLDTVVARERRSIAFLQLARGGAIAVGILISAMSHVEMNLLGWLTASTPPLVLGLVAWATTAPALAKTRPVVERMFHLRGALAVCCSSGGDGCPKIWAEFWRTLHQNAGIDPV